MEHRVTEVLEIEQELINFKTDTPIWKERGKNIAIIGRALRTLREVYDEDRKIIIERFAEKDEESGQNKMKEEINQATGKMERVYDFGENDKEAKKQLTDLWNHTFIKSDGGMPVMIEIEFKKVPDDKARKLDEMKLSGLAYAIDALGL